jgi:F420-dependent oxidoreductase-like protein
MPAGTIGVQIQERDAALALAAIERAEQSGVPAVWMTTGGLAPDAIEIFAAAAARTERVLFGTAIAPFMHRHPLAMLAQALAVAQLAPGRLRLGIGASHKPSVEGTYGIPFDRPLGRLREYVAILRQGFEGGAVDFDGRFYHAHARLAAPLAQPPAIMASALRENAFRLCGELTDGAITWLCPLPYCESVALPALRAGAQSAGRAAPPLIAHVPIALTEDAGALRDLARQQLAGYPRLPYYSQMLVDAGFPEAAEGSWSDAMIDGVVVHGDEAAVAKRLDAFIAAGAGEIIAAPVLPAENRDAALARTYAFIGALAKWR